MCTPGSGVAAVFPAFGGRPRLDEASVARLKRRALGAVCGVVLALAVPLSVRAQVGTVTGMVQDAVTAAPLSSVQVYIEGLQVGSLSQANGRYLIPNVPVGTHTITAVRIGYRAASQQVTVTAGGAVTANLAMQETALMLEGIVATGLIDPVEGVKSPVSVARVDRLMMPVVVGAASAVQNLQGKVAGLQMSQLSGQPGQDVQVLLRSPTSVQLSTQPLYVVDGVILGTSPTNIESLDVESIEVVKGAAAASLYGSRANNGGISIRTRRGSQLAIGETRFSVRSEVGTSRAYRGGFNEHHYYLMDEGQTTYVDRNGNPVTRKQRVAPPAYLAFSDKSYPTQTYDNFDAMFAGGGYETQNFSMMQNTENTNFAIAVNRLREGGPLINNDGYERSSFRLNLDHRFLEDFNLAVSSFHSRDALDVPKVNWTQLLLAPPDLDVTTKDENGEYIRVPDAQVAYENPLWREGSRDQDRERVRTLASANLRWEPATWLSFMGNVSYDRENSQERTYLPKGTPLSATSTSLSNGQIRFSNTLHDTWNAEAQVQLRRDFFNALNVRTTFRALMERAESDSTVAEGTNFFVTGVPRIDAAATKNAASLFEEVRALGYLVDAAFDYDGKYIATMLLRRDGSSLFGPDNRWHNYYRAAVAWRWGEEPWFSLPSVSEFKLSYARGTAGGRPLFAHQYETWNVTSSGVSKGTLGNRQLAPELTTEQEFSLETILFERIGVDLAYAWHRTEDQIVRSVLPAFTGYEAQWANGGVLTGNSMEATIEAQIVQTPTFGWTSVLVFDHSTGKIEEWPFASIRPGHRNWQAGEPITGVHGTVLAWNPNVLCESTWTAPARVKNDGHGSVHHGGKACDRADEFELNDEGWLVWVGEGNHYWEGIEKGLWGTSTNIGGAVYEWGIPFWWLDANGSPRREQMADAATYNLGLTNNLRWGQWSVHTSFSATFGAEVVDGYHRGHIDFHPRQDMFGPAGERPDELKKPARHWWALAGGGGAIHLERIDFLKLRQASVNYRFTRDQLSRWGLGAVDGVTLGLVGRNLINLTNCPCPDGEMGLTIDVRGNSVTRGYPATRSLTAEMEVTF